MTASSASSASPASPTSSGPTVSVALFTSDLRLRDNPVLRAALAAAEGVVPLFVLDRAVEEAGFAVPNRRAFLADCLAALDEGLRERGGRLVVRSGDPAEETTRLVHECGAHEVHIAGGVSGYAQQRETRLRMALEEAGCALRVHDAVITAVAPGALTPSGGRDHFAVFTPYFRRWSQAGRRTPLAAPRAVPVPEAPGSLRLPRREGARGAAPGLARGGERAGRERWASWRRKGGLQRYGQREGGQNDLGADATSRLSPHLHFGSLSPVELAHEAAAKGGAGAEAFVRQLAWRDFHHQVLAARPAASYTDYRPHGDRWRGTEGDAEREIAAWREGRTGYPLVDAGMRQLLHEGWMHNRARLLAASFLTKTLYVDWRIGAAHFLAHLVDGDIANNQLNWQWAAGTGTDTRPNRVLNPLTQARSYDPQGTYVRRWVPELAAVEGAAVHRPWRLPAAERARLDYPEPVVDLGEGQARFRAARQRDRG
ncbi:deoxyribodipyrimidine photo-lyase [Streptomyces oryzae]|uniref:Deoxyribodipyrimidine photo-lyase n=1 Tax=Streptomyces oryzae TaxID=1434886 RepID=A0ABS3XLP3_9ACTN|nr:deoxyribodipyrimidine photo-lyase [Streptomyces oryzae]MBO8196325.1 deoxyribodipyrimidine photo-lyase [Streptomyces oryzae]